MGATRLTTPLNAAQIKQAEPVLNFVCEAQHDQPRDPERAASHPEHAAVKLIAGCLFWVASCAAVAAPDEALLGSAQGYPAGPAAGLASHLVAGERPQNLVASFGGALEQLLPSRVVPRGDTVLPLPGAAMPQAYLYHHEGQQLGVDDYLARRRVTGLLILKDGVVTQERYQYGRTPQSRFLSASMAKSVIGLLVGIALGEGKIASLDDPAQRYAPGLAGGPYGETSIGDLLAMSSGVGFAEQYDGRDDLSDLIEGTVGQRPPGGAGVLRPYQDRRAAPGKLFYYSSADTQALGLVLRGATGMPVADYMSSRLWQPLGAEDDASWVLDAAGQEATFAFLHARLRDFGRLGLLLANGGRVGNRQLIPADWLRSATGVAGPHTQPFVASSYFGYGWQFWIFPGEKRRFALIGVRGQVIFVDPELKLVLVQTAVWPTAGDRASRAELLALWDAVVAHHQK